MLINPKPGEHLKNIDRLYEQYMMVPFECRYCGKTNDLKILTATLELECIDVDQCKRDN